MTVAPGTTLTVRAPAKVNLHLGVGAPREDGFHPLETVFHAIGLHDDITATVKGSWSLDLRAASYVEAGAVPLDDTNIVAHAARLLADHHGLSSLDAEVLIDKSIPVAGGMAGGSADGAAALVVLDRLFDLRTSDEAILDLAARLGSDVPFALYGGTALGTGRGEVITPQPDRTTWWWVLVPSADGLSTPAVYRRWDEMFPGASETPTSARRVLAAIEVGSPYFLGVALHNDLQAAACDLRPDLTALIERGEAEGAHRGIVSGSGPTCAFICDDADSARAVAAALQGAGHPVVLVANGPVAGAHVVSYL